MKDVNGRVNGKQFTASHLRLTFVYVQNLPYFTHSPKIFFKSHNFTETSNFSRTSAHSRTINQLHSQSTPTSLSIKMPNTMSAEMEYIALVYRDQIREKFAALWEGKSTPPAPVFPASAPASPNLYRDDIFPRGDRND